MFIAHGRKNSSPNETLKKLLVSDDKINKSKKQMGKEISTVMMHKTDHLDVIFVLKAIKVKVA